jgi:hypothetical protein
MYWGFYSLWKFNSIPKVNTLQLSTRTISHSTNTHRASTLSDVPHKTPSTGPLLVISQHELIFLQSESLQHRCASSLYALRAQTHILAIGNSPSTRASLAISQYQVFQPTGVRSQTHTHVFTRLGYFQSRTPAVD